MELLLETLTLIANLNFDGLGNELKLQKIGHTSVFWKKKKQFDMQFLNCCLWAKFTLAVDGK